MSPLYIVIPLSILSIAIVLFNVAVCCLVCCNKKLRTFTNGFIVSLAISDIMVGAILFPCYLTNPFGTAEFIGYIVSIILLAGVANLCTVTYDRYLALSHPLTYKYRVSKIFVKAIIASWTIPIIYSLLPLIWRTDMKLPIHKIYIIGLQVFGVMIPYVLIVTAYVRIYVKVKRSLKRRRKFSMNSLQHSKQERRRVSSEVKVAKVFSIVAASFILCWIPVIYITTADQILNKQSLIPEPLGSISLFTVAFSSLVNPLLYSFMKPDFHQVICKALRFCITPMGSRNEQTIVLSPISVCTENNS